MKKLISVLLVFIILMTSFPIPAPTAVNSQEPPEDPGLLYPIGDEGRGEDESPLQDTEYSPFTTYPIGDEIDTTPEELEWVRPYMEPSRVEEEPWLPEGIEPASYSPSFRMTTDPSMIIPGKPLTLSWIINDADELDLDSTMTIRIHLPDGIVPVDSALLSLIENGVLEMGVSGVSGQIELIDQEAPETTKIAIRAELAETNQVLDEGLVVLPIYQSEEMSLLASPANTMGVVITGVETFGDAPIVFTIGYPSPQTAPNYSLSSNMVEINAINVSTGTDVTSFDTPIQVSMPYDSSRFSEIEAAELEVYYYNETNLQWYPIETTVNTSDHTLSFETDHLTVFDYKKSDWQSYIPPVKDFAEVSGYTGAATYQKEIEVFEGPGGIKPSITLSYNSQIVDEGKLYNQANWVGMGWSLDLGLITRDMHGTRDNTKDDTFMISMAGYARRLLPVKFENGEFLFATSQASFDRISYNTTSDAWKILTKDGLIYEFGSEAGDKARINKENGCANSSRPANLTWGWGLSRVSDRFGNQINYSYNVTSKSSACNATQVDIQPDEIVYSNFKLGFNYEPRSDYLTSWESNDAKVLFSKNRLTQISYFIKNASGGYDQVKSLKFEYVDNNPDLDIINPGLKWRDPSYNEGAVWYTTTLRSVYELPFGTETSLPRVRFSYGDNLHLTKIENGYGGETQFKYQLVSYYDNAVDEYFTNFYGFGEGECIPTAGEYISQWVDSNKPCPNPPYCDFRLRCTGVNGSLILAPHASDPVFANTTLPESLAKPGARYHGYLVGTSMNGQNPGVYWGLKANGSLILVPDYPPMDRDSDPIYSDFKLNDGELEGDFNLPVRAENPDTMKTHILNLRGGVLPFISAMGGYVSQVQYVRFMYRYVVSERIEKESFPEQEAKWIYSYGDLKTNSAETSQAVNDCTNSGVSECLYTLPHLEFRGFSSVTIVREDLGKDQYTEKYTYGSSDSLKGKVISADIGYKRASDGAFVLQRRTEYAYRSEPDSKVFDNEELWQNDASSNQYFSLRKYKDLDVFWTRLATIKESVYYQSSDSFSGYKTVFYYNATTNPAAELINAKNFIANLTRSDKYLITQSSETFYSSDQTSYLLEKNDQYWLTSLPTRVATFPCATGSCSPFTEVQYKYGDGTVLHRLLAEKKLHDRSGGQYIQTSYDYYSNGTVRQIISHNSFAIGENSWLVMNSPGIKTKFVYSSTFPSLPVTEEILDMHNAVVASSATTYHSMLGLPTTVTDINGNVEKQFYDPYGRVIEIWAKGDSTATTMISYVKASGLPFKIIVSQAEMAVKHYFFNGFGQLLQVQNEGVEIYDLTGNQVETWIRYDRFGRKVAESQPSGMGEIQYLSREIIPSDIAIARIYDAMDRPVTVGYLKSGSSGNFTGTDLAVQSRISYDYINYGGKLALQQTTRDAFDDGSRETRFVINELGQTVETIPPANTGPSVKYEYDLAGRLKKSNYGGAISEIDYFSSGLKRQMNDADMGQWSYEYDALGNLTRQEDSEHNVIILSYDSAGRLISKGSPGGAMIQYEYGTEAGQIGYRVGMTDPSGWTAWMYDARGRVTRKTQNIHDAETFTTEWTYTRNDQVKTMTYPNGNTIVHSYTAQGTIDRIWSGENNVILDDVGYDGAGRVTQKTHALTGGALTITQEWAPYFVNGQWQSDGGRLRRLYASNTGLLDITYGYDLVGNITALEASGTTQTYTYDALDRLTTAIGVGGSYPYAKETYGYSAGTGNLISKTGVGDYQYLGASKHAVTQAGQNTYGYDDNGNMTSSSVGNTEYVYDLFNNLVQIKKGGQVAFEYAYNGDGERVWEKVHDLTGSNHGSETVYIGNWYEKSRVGYGVGGQTMGGCMGSFCMYLPLMFKPPVETLYYYAGGERIAMMRGGVFNYLLGDHLGSVVATVDRSGTLTSSSSYYPWGTTHPNSGASPTDYGFTGQMQEGDIYFYNARWYDPQLGRFMQADTIVPSYQGTQGFDRYAYVNNNPMKYTDPSGHRLWEGDGGGDYNWHYDYVMDELYSPAEREHNVKIANTILDVILITGSIVSEPIDWAVTASECLSGDCSPWALLGFLPIIPGIVGNKADDIIDIGRRLDDIPLRGQKHHIFSKKIWNAMSDPLKKAFENNRNSLVVRAVDYAAHHGYQEWHRMIDTELAYWILMNNPSKDSLINKLIELYIPLSDRFPTAINYLMNIK